MTLTRAFATAATGIALAAAAVPVTALAQDMGAQQEMAVPDEMLTAFVTAALDVAAVQSAYQEQFNTAPDEATQIAVAEEAQAAMVTAVEEAEGITVDEYIAINQAAQVDGDLNARIQAKVQEMVPATE